MRAYTLRSEQFVPTPIDGVFPFFTQPENLERITPPSLHFSILSPSPVPMHVGAVVDYRIYLRCIPQRWRTRIVEYDPPFGFVDQQVRGPYQLWIHRHTFVPKGSGTVILDEVRYTLPFGPLGRLVHAVYVQHELNRIFAYRRSIIAQLFGDERNQLAPASSWTGNNPGRTA